MYHAGSVRPLLVVFYLVALLFGLLRLGARRLMLLALLALAAHGIVLALLLVVLPLFAAMGGYVTAAPAPCRQPPQPEGGI